MLRKGKKMELFKVANYKHNVGDRRCCECWAGFPQRCKCKGLIHAQFVKENWEGELNVQLACDNCGELFKKDKEKKKSYGKKYKK